MFYVGRRGSLGIAKETNRGIAVAPAYWIPYNSISLDDKADIVDQDSAFGQIADADSSYITKKYGEGEFEYDLEDKALGVILAGLAGATPVSTGSTNYTHTYTLQNTNQHQSLSLLVQDPNLSRMFALGMINEFTIKVEPKGLVKCTVSFRSKKGMDFATQSAVYSTVGNKFIHTMLSFKLATNIAGIAASSAINLRSLELKVSKNVEDFNDMGTVTPSDILNKQLSVKGSIELGFNDATYKNYMLDGTTKALEILFTYGTNNSLQIQMPKVRFANWEPNKGLNDIATEKIEFKGLYDVTNTLNVISTLILKNQVSSY